jgi:broad specificity phosphatase PhoE
MEDRLRTALDKICAVTASPVAVVTHGGALRALMPIIKNQPKETSFNYDFENASLTKFEYKHGSWQLIA